MVRIYKSGDYFFKDDSNFQPNKYNLIVSGTRVRLAATDGSLMLETTEISEIFKEDGITPYASAQELREALDGFFRWESPDSTFEQQLNRVFPSYIQIAQDIDITSDQYVDILTLEETDVPDGVYYITISLSISNPDLNDSFFYQIDYGQVPVRTFSIEPKDVSDVIPLTFSTPFPITQGEINMILRARKEDPQAETINIGIASVDIERKGPISMIL